MIEHLCSADPVYQKLVFAVVLGLWQGLETWLGKTERVKAGSTPEAVLNGIKKVLALTKGLIWKKPTN